MNDFMKTRELVLSFPEEEQTYRAYKIFRGYKSKKEFKILEENFIKHTINNFVFGEFVEGDPIVDEKGYWLYPSKEASVDGFCKSCKISSKEAHRIFKALDIVSSYT